MPFENMRNAAMNNVLRLLFILAYGFHVFIWGFLMFPWPDAASWFYGRFLWADIPLRLLCVAMLLFRQWKSAVTIGIALGLFMICNTQAMKARPWIWFVAQGFRLHAGVIDRYLERCKLTDFTEAGAKHEVGDCETYSNGVTSYVIFYDSSDEIAAPLARRSPQWQDAMYHGPPKMVPWDSEGRAVQMLGHFYLVPISQE